MYKNIYYFNFIPEIEFARFFHQDLQLRLHVIRLRKSHNLRPARPTSKADKENTSTNVISRPRRNLFSGQRVHDLFSSRFTSYDQLSFESTVHQFSSAWLEPCIKNVLSVCMAFCFLSLSLSLSLSFYSRLYSGIPGNTSLAFARPTALSPTPNRISFCRNLYFTSNFFLISARRIRCQPRISAEPVSGSSFLFRFIYQSHFTTR